MDKKRIEGLMTLFAADGLPPNIKVLVVPIHLDKYNHLGLNEKPKCILFNESEGQEVEYLLDDVDLTEQIFNGNVFLAGFSDELQVLILGVLPPEDQAAWHRA